MKGFTQISGFKILILLLLACWFSSKVYAQGRLEYIRMELDSLSEVMPGLNQEVDLSVSGLSLNEFIRNIANTTDLNINIAESVNGIITNNFSNVPAKDVLLFVCKEYDLDIEISGKILSFYKYEPPPEKIILKDPVIIYDSVNHLLTMDLQEDSLIKVIRKITDLSHYNIIPRPGLESKMITIYLQDMDFDDALGQMAFANDLTVIEKDGYYLLNSTEKVAGKDSKGMNKGGKVKDSDFYYKVEDYDKISVYAVNVPIADIVNELSKALKVNFFIYSEMKELTTVNLLDVSYSELLVHILNGTKYTYSMSDGIYLIGERQSEKLRVSKVVKMNNRSVVDISQTIPSYMTSLVEIQEFHELNSIILSGSHLQIKEIEEFLKAIDKVVPVILIEVLIVVHKSGFSVSTGIEAGLSDEPVKTSGSIMPIDMTLGASTINNIINSFNGLGLVNLGKVMPNFYVSLKALEDQGVVDVISTPRLATMNGHEATLKIGETEYYMEEKSQIFANQTTTQEKIREFKPVTADFILTIYPIVSGDDQITLEIKLEQSDFTGTKLSPGAPPDQVSRSFTSIIRVRNEEMILLGGLEDKSKSHTSTGVPFLSRIPVLKWIFSSREKKDSEEKLNVFIKPTVIY